MTTGPLGDTFAAFTYNNLNMLTQAGATTYIYDGEGNRISQMVSGQTTTYVTDPNAELSRLLITNQPDGSQTFYVYGLGLISQEHIPAGSNTGEYRVFHYDFRGSTTALTDFNGNITNRWAYDPFGHIIGREGNTETPFLYIAQWGCFTDSNGLIYMRARYYNPQISRFINEDPIKSGTNWYLYAGGNPINFIDPNGLVAFAPAAVAAGKALLAMAGGATIGAGVGAGADAAVQLIDNGGDFRNLDTDSIRGSAAGGATTGALLAVPGVGQLGVGQTMLWAGASSGFGYNVSGYVSGQETTLEGTINAVGVGAVTGGVGRYYFGPNCPPQRAQARPSVSGKIDWSNISGKGESVLNHVNRHATPNYQRANHGVFRGDPKTMVERAWANRGSVTPISDGMGGVIYNIPYSNAGYQSGFINFGQQMNYITIIVQDGTSKIWTAFPSFGTHGMQITLP